MSSLIDHGERFRRLHAGPGAFVVPNPWDAGTASLLETLGFEALVTTSAGHAFSMGHRDGHASREAVLDHIGLIAAATDLPAGLEDGYGATPEAVAATITEAAGRGVVGGSSKTAAAGPADRACTS